MAQSEISLTSTPLSLFFHLTLLHMLSQQRAFWYCLTTLSSADRLSGRDWVKSLVARWPAGPLIRQIRGGSGHSGDEGLLTGAWTILSVQRFGWHWWCQFQIADWFFLTAAATIYKYWTIFWIHMCIFSVCQNALKIWNERPESNNKYQKSFCWFSNLRVSKCI